MLNKCSVVSCSNKKPRRYFLCSSCWSKIPNHIRADIRYGIEKGKHSLKVNPDKNWITKVMGYVGLIKIAYVVGAGVDRVKLADDKREL